jgi:hypothetical protein
MIEQRERHEVLQPGEALHRVPGMVLEAVHPAARRLAASRETPAEPTRRAQPQVIKGLAP